MGPAAGGKQRAGVCRPVAGATLAGGRRSSSAGTAVAGGVRLGGCVGAVVVGAGPVDGWTGRGAQLAAEGESLWKETVTAVVYTISSKSFKYMHEHIPEYKPIPELQSREYPPKEERA